MVILDYWFTNPYIGDVTYLTRIWHNLTGCASEWWYNSIPWQNRYVQPGWLQLRRDEC